MPRAITYGGEVRHYEVFIPKGLEVFYQVLAGAPYSRTGVPVVVALHGTRNIIEVFRQNWEFPAVAEGSTDVEDKFVTVYICGMSVNNADRDLSNPGGPPARYWNVAPGAAPGDADDEGLVNAVLADAEPFVADYLVSRGVTVPGGVVFDVKRYHLFGYSGGGILAFRVASLQVDRWALSTIRTKCGGRRT